MSSSTKDTKNVTKKERARVIFLISKSLNLNSQVSST